MSTFILWAAVFMVLLVAFARAWWRNTVIRKSMTLSDDIVRLLSMREITWLRRGLREYLATPEGLTLADDPRVVARLALFDERIRDARGRLVRTRRTRALRAAGLPQLPADNQERDA